MESVRDYVFGKMLDSLGFIPPPQVARPIVKFVGGKTRLLPELLKRVPQKFGRYHEPFVGGGALFFALQAARPKEMRGAILSDSNHRLIEMYQGIKDDVHDVVHRLHRMPVNEKYFYKVRAIDVDAIPSEAPGRSAAIAAWFIYLNKTCFNGLYRVNRRGEFNAPYGHYKNPKVCDAPNLRACSRALEDTILRVSSFEGVLNRAKRGDFVFADPPYLPTNITDFTAYNKEGFGWEQHVQLADVMVKLRSKGVHVLLSNSSSPRIRVLYQERDFRVETVYAPRSVNSNGKDRGLVEEFLIS